MSEAVKHPGNEPLLLDSAWRTAESNPGGATIHPLRVVPGEGRRGAIEGGAIEGDELRKLVSEIVREELRSELGRRMTGSIRRLVRDEVARIFAGLGRR